MPLTAEEEARVAQLHAWVQEAVCETSLAEFVRKAWPLIEPDKPLLWNWHIDLLCEYLEAVTAGECKRLIVNIPPRSIKSTLITIMWPCWEWTTRPEQRYLFASYASELSTEHSLKRRMILESEWYTRAWPKAKLVQNLQTRYNNASGGHMIATSMTGVGTGMGGSRVICLWYDTLIETSAGLLPIGEIVEKRLPVKVLAFDHKAKKAVWRNIEAYESSVGRQSVKVAFSNGREIRLTADHPIFVTGKGYVPAESLCFGDRVLDASDMRYLRNAVQEGAEGCSEVHETLLFSGVRESGRVRAEQPCVRGWFSDSLLHGLWERLSRKAGDGQSPEVLFAGVPSRGIPNQSSAHERSHRIGMRLLRRTDSTHSSVRASDELLLKDVCESVSQRPHAGYGQRPLRPRTVGVEVSGRVSRDASEHQSSGRRMPEVRDDAQGTWQGALRSSRQLRQDGQPAIESHIPLRAVPRVGARPTGVAQEVDAVLVTSVERIGKPERVYNVRVAEHHNYFANGILAHNCDDPMNAKEAYSEAERNAVNRNFDTTFPSRLDDKKRDAIIVVMQRLHDDDLTGHLLARDKTQEWTHVCLPTEAKTRTVVHFPSGREVIREAGSLLWPEREGPEEIASLKVANGTRDFEAQYNQEPAPPGGAMFHTDWWKFYREAPSRFDEVIQSWDMTFKDASTSDYVVGQVWGRKGSEKYLLDQVRERADFPTTVRLFRMLSAKWPQAEKKLIEDAANGPAVIAQLRSEIEGIVAVTPKGSKEARAAAVTATIEAGNVYLPDETIAAWIGDFIFEASRFPFGTHDDQVDACTQALSRMVSQWSTADILAWGGIKEEEA